MSVTDTDHALEIYEAFHPNAKEQKKAGRENAALADLIGKVASEGFRALTEDEPELPAEKDDAAAKALLQAVQGLTEATAANTRVMADLCTKVEAIGKGQTEHTAAIRELATAAMAETVVARGSDKLITKLTKKKAS
jgi:hypothetical protein